MAVFMVNSCKFRGCNLIFETLAELIQHIEEAHIEADPKILEQQENEQPTAIALSQVLKFYGGAKPKKSLLAIATSNSASSGNKKNRQRNNSVMSTSASIRSLTPTSSEYDFDDDDSTLDILGGGSVLEMMETGDKSGSVAAEQQWINQLVLRMMSQKSDDIEKPYACPIKGCRKRYKNINGVKYHAKNGHKREARMAKLTSKCFCGKSFHSAKQLELHTEAEHSLSSFGVISSGVCESPLSDPNLSITVKDEPSTPTTTTIDSKAPLSIIHPITISGGVLLTPATARHLKTVNKGEILVAQKLPAGVTSSLSQQKTTVASLVCSSASTSLVTPPTTPQKRTPSSSLQCQLHHVTSNLSLTPPPSQSKSSTSTLSLSASPSSSSSRSQELCDQQQQQAINEKVARALAAAKQAMEAAAKSNNGTSAVSSSVANTSSSAAPVPTPTQTVITLKN